MAADRALQADAPCPSSWGCCHSGSCCLSSVRWPLARTSAARACRRCICFEDDSAAWPLPRAGFHYGSSCMSPWLLSRGALLKRDDFVRKGCRSLLSKSYKAHYGGGAALLRSTAYSRTARLSTPSLLSGCCEEPADDSDM